MDKKIEKTIKQNALQFVYKDWCELIGVIIIANIEERRIVVRKYFGAEMR
jgi:hypothetical protein